MLSRFQAIMTLPLGKNFDKNYTDITITIYLLGCLGKLYQNTSINNMTKNNFVGTWKLVSWESTSGDGQTCYPFGKHPIGYITYTESGYMSATIMKAHRLNIEVSSAELMNARKVFLRPWLLVTAFKYIKAITRYLQASANYVSYSGKYEIQAETVIHYVEISLIPDWIGTEQLRQFQFIGDRLVLVTPPIGGNPQTLTWERA